MTDAQMQVLGQAMGAGIMYGAAIGGIGFVIFFLVMWRNG